MRSLANPEVLRKAATAALLSGLLCLPRLWMAPQSYSLWYLEAKVVLGSFVLWSFVFAWHTRYTHRPVFTLNIEPGLVILSTIAASVLAACFYLWLDPLLRIHSPGDYPPTLRQWIAITLYSLVFTQMFLVFAPLAWLVRLTGKIELAVPLSLLFGLVSRAVVDHSIHLSLPLGLSLALWTLRGATALLAFYLYLRGGVFMVWWSALLLQSRHLLHIDL